MKAVFVTLLFFWTGSALAAEYRIEAGSGHLQAFIASGRLAGGDRVVLEPGYHGTVVISDMRFDKPVLVTGTSGERVALDQLVIRNSAGWRIQDLVVMSTATGEPRGTLVDVHESRDIHLDRLTVMSTRDSRSWTSGQWRSSARNGIELSGEYISVTDSHIRNVRHGISSTAERARVERNRIELFSGDGIRGLGDNSDYIGNTIDTCVGVDKNHDDGFQSWSRDTGGRPGKGRVRNVRLEGNFILNGDHPLSCHLQGIGLFDGMYENWTIRDNTVIVDHWHGITVMGARDVVISGNKVLDSHPGKPGAPWITITAHKEGWVAENSIIEGNVTFPWAGRQVSPFRQPQPGVTSHGNRVVKSLEEGLGAGR